VRWAPPARNLEPCGYRSWGRGQAVDGSPCGFWGTLRKIDLIQIDPLFLC